MFHELYKWKVHLSRKEVYLIVLNVTVIAIKFPSDEFHGKQLQSERVISNKDNFKGKYFKNK